MPKPLLDQAGIELEVEVVVEGNTLILHSVKKSPRQGWAKSFEEMSEKGDDRLFDVNTPLSDWDREEWKWK